jgi:hypothetical protein
VGKAMSERESWIDHLQSGGHICNNVSWDVEANRFIGQKAQS